MKNIIRLLLIVLYFPIQSFAADDSLQAKEFISEFGNKIIAIADNKKFTVEKRKDKLIDFIDSNVDSKWIAKFVLARHYRTANREQVDRFMDLYRQFMIRTYAPKFDGYNGEKFEVTDVVSQGRYYIVKCLFYPKNSAPAISVDFRLKQKVDGGNFVILDIVAEGVSLIETQRSEFGSVISTEGFDKFIDDLAIRVENLKKAK